MGSLLYHYGLLDILFFLQCKYFKAYKARLNSSYAIISCQKILNPVEVCL
jgi:hypothetical protein